MRRLAAAAEAVAITCMVVLFGVLLAQVLLRPFGIGLAFVEELSIFVFIWFVFFSVAVAYRRNEHLAIDIVHHVASRRLSPAALRAWDAAVRLVEILFLAIFAIGVALMVRQAWGLFAGTLSGFRYGYLYLGVLIGTALALAAASAGLRPSRRPDGASAHDAAVER